MTKLESAREIRNQNGDCYGVVECKDCFLNGSVECSSNRVPKAQAYISQHTVKPVYYIFVTGWMNKRASIFKGIAETEKEMIGMVIRLRKHHPLKDIKIIKGNRVIFSPDR